MPLLDLQGLDAHDHRAERGGRNPGDSAASVVQCNPDQSGLSLLACGGTSNLSLVIC
jgi:hypothetical protein